ncbi:MAG: transposase [Sphaerochaetaceae bacterium]
MAGRPPRDDGKFRVSVHINNGYRYACTQPWTIDAGTGKKKYRQVYWGQVDENLKFLPNAKYIYASDAEKDLLDFPPEWDLSEIHKLSGARSKGRPAYDGTDVNRFYGDIWLLEQVATRTGLRKDLETVFDGNKEIVDDILTLAMFPYVTGFTYNRVARWQKIAKSPSKQELTPPVITLLTQSITEAHRMKLLKLRSARLRKEELCAVDSTSRSAYGRSLADIRWGKNKECLPLEQTVEVVVYTLDSHMPVYYRTFPGNMQDSRSLETILTDLHHAGFSDVVLVTDRGYEKIRNLETYILKNQAMIMCTKVQQSLVMERILQYGDFSVRPDGMDIDRQTKLYYQQFDIDYPVVSTGTSVKQSEKLRLNLYFDSVRRSEELVQLDIDITVQRQKLQLLLEEQQPLEDDQSLKHLFRYYKLQYDTGDRILRSFEPDHRKVEKARRASGFFSIMTHKLDMDAMETYRAYKLRDEQEKAFQQMKSQMVGDRQRNWSEEGKTGRLLILFVSMILGSVVRHTWKTTELYDLFSSSLEVLDEMRTIRCIEHTVRAKFITPFVGRQLDICEAFGFDVPQGCAPDYVSRRKQPKKRGRPRKPATETDL